jgi:hypothetical protein
MIVLAPKNIFTARKWLRLIAKTGDGICRLTREAPALSGICDTCGWGFPQFL